MHGMNARTGLRIDGTDHLQQSITDILLTQVGSRVMRREYGSLIPELIDQPINEATLLQLYAATVIALQQWEPRIVVQNVRAELGGPAGGIVLKLDALRRDSGQLEALAISLRGAA